MSTPHLEVAGLGLSFGGLAALTDVTFKVERGSVFALIGPNGAGKTTIFNCISGLYRPDHGRILFNGDDLNRLTPDRVARRGIARTFQNIELFKHMTALQNLMLGRHLHFKAGTLRCAIFGPGARAEEVRHREKVEQILDFLDLEAARDQFVASMPYGTQKMVELGRALAMEPELILLDEPSAGMNAEEKQDLIWRIKDVRDEFGITVLLVEHDMRLMEQVSDRVVVLDHGELIAAGTPAEVQQHPDVLVAYLGVDAEPAPTDAEEPRAVD